MANEIQILCTRPIADDLLQDAKANGIHIDIIPFIQTEAIRSVEVQQEIEASFQFAATVVFTSMNAVEAVAAYLVDEMPLWRIFCIGQTTKQLVEEYFPASAIIGTADNAKELAELIASTDTEDLIFFCGDQRRNELPDILSAHDVFVNEVMVYQTIPIPQKISKEYHGILFFSPSAVSSFFSVNKLTSQTVLFAIGSTTAEEIRKHTGNKIIIGDQPGKESLYDKMMEYFT